MELIKINYVGFQPLETAINRLRDRTGGDRRAVTNMFDASTGMFGGHDNLIALATGLKPIANNLFAIALRLGSDWVNRIHFRGVENINPRIQCHIHLRKSIRLVGLGAIGHSAQAKIRDHNAGLAQFIHFHLKVLLLRIR